MYGTMYSGAPSKYSEAPSNAVEPCLVTCILAHP
jgi:hypothetical protein